MGRGAWWATVRGVTESQTGLSEFTSLHWFTGSLTPISPLPQSPHSSSGDTKPFSSS